MRMMWSPRLVAAVLIVPLFVLAAGCNRNANSEGHTVTGSVKYKGQGLVKAVVYLAAGKGMVGMGVTQQDGSFTMTNIPEGTYTVLVDPLPTLDQAGNPVPPVPPGGNKGPGAMKGPKGFGKGPGGPGMGPGGMGPGGMGPGGMGPGGMKKGMMKPGMPGTVGRGPMPPEVEEQLRTLQKKYFNPEKSELTHTVSGDSSPLEITLQ